MPPMQNQAGCSGRSALQRVQSESFYRTEAGEEKRKSSGMTISISIVPLVVAIIGLVLMFVPNNAKLNRVGEILLLSGSLSYLLGSHK